MLKWLFSLSPLHPNVLYHITALFVISSAGFSLSDHVPEFASSSLSLRPPPHVYSSAVILYRHYTVCEEALAPQRGFDASETDRAEALAGIILIKVDVEQTDATSHPENTVLWTAVCISSRIAHEFLSVCIHECRPTTSQTMNTDSKHSAA